MTSWKAIVNSGKYSESNARFATKREAMEYASYLYSRQPPIRKTRAIESNNPVNSRWSRGRVVDVKAKKGMK